MSDFEIMQKMAIADQDIGMSGNIVQCQKVKKGGHITMGVDDATFFKIMNTLTGGEGYYVVLYVINKEQFLSYKKE